VRRIVEVVVVIFLTKCFTPLYDLHRDIACMNRAEVINEGYKDQCDDENVIKGGVADA
jgi:hypothetical protein